MTAQQELATGLTALRGSYGYRKTKQRWGGRFPQSVLGRAETRFMVAKPTRATVNDGLALLRDSWAYKWTRAANPVAAMFSKTLVGKAEAAFKRAVAALPVAQTGLGLFAGNGLFCVNPRGGVENSDEFAAAGFKWAAGNVGDHGVEEWEAWRLRMLQHAVTPIPWRRCYTPAQLEDLAAIAKQWGAPACVPNVENPEATTNVTPYVIAGIIDRNPGIRYGVLTEPWLQNGAGWHELGQRNVIAIPEAFLNADPRWQPAVLRDHALAEGMSLCAPAFGAGVWSDAPYLVPPSTYFAQWPAGPYSVYPIDGKDARAWKRP